ncbi:hypothetical protein ACS0TY_021370 [Phlomoides rotata]
MKRIGISGSPKFDISVADFGWGKARKLEVVSLDICDEGKNGSFKGKIGDRVLIAQGKKWKLLQLYIFGDGL